MRFWFGQSPTDWTMVLGAETESNGVKLRPAIAAGPIEVTFWDAATGGTQYTDLLDASGEPITHVTTADGTGTLQVGTIPRFQGPDGVMALWADAGGGARYLMVATSIGEVVEQVRDDADSAASAISIHVSDDNPHQTRLSGLIDVDATDPDPGQVLAWNDATERWEPATVDGLTNVVTLDTPQTITAPKVIRIPDGDITSQAFAIRIPAGDRATAPDTLAFFYNAGTDENPDWQRTGYFNEYGELRVVPSAPFRVPVRIRLLNGQSAHAFQVADLGNNPRMWITAGGQVRAPNISTVPPFSIRGDVAAGPGAVRWYNDIGHNITLRAVRANVGAPPDGNDLIVDVNIDGSSIWSDPSGRPVIPDGGLTSGAVTTIGTTTLAPGSYLTVDVDQVGTDEPGSDLTVQILAY